jgi:amino acid transporter
MKKNLKTKIAIFLILITAFFVVGAANAQIPTRAAQDTAFISATGINTGATVSSIVATVITVLLGLLGIIFVVLLVYAGIQWMTAEGNEEKVEHAKNTITRAIIGLLIIIAAYSITYFVFNALNKANGGGGTPTINHSP